MSQPHTEQICYCDPTLRTLTILLQLLAAFLYSQTTFWMKADSSQNLWETGVGGRTFSTLEESLYFARGQIRERKQVDCGAGRRIFETSIERCCPVEKMMIWLQFLKCFNALTYSKTNGWTKKDFTTAKVLKPYQKIGRSKHHRFHLSTCSAWDFSLPLSRWWDWRKSKMLIQFTCSHKYENCTIKNQRPSKNLIVLMHRVAIHLSHLFVWLLVWCWGL